MYREVEVNLNSAKSCIYCTHLIPVSLYTLIPVSLYVLDRNQYNRPKAPPDSYSGSVINPYRRHRRVKDEEKISRDVWEDYAQQILDLVLYDVEDCQALRNFEPVKNNTHCIFSRTSVLWGARDYDSELSLGIALHRIAIFGLVPQINLS